MNGRYADFLYQEQEILPAVSIDCVIFGFHEGQLKVLLVNFGNTQLYGLPGGFIKNHESLDQAAQQILYRRTGIASTYLEQFYVFGESNRVYSDTHKFIMESNGVELPPEHFLLRRFVSIGYYALVDFTKIHPNSQIENEASYWCDIYDLPKEIAFDHERIIQKAWESLRMMLDHKLAFFDLMPETFTMNELQRLFETILNKKFLRANFQRKMLSLGILQRLDKKWGGGAHKAPYLYKFDEAKALLYANSTTWEQP